MSPLLLGMLLTVVAGLADALGGLLATGIKLTRAYLEVLVSLGAGFILAVAFLDLLPEVFEETPHAALYVALGYLTLFATENVFSRRAHDPEHHEHELHGHALVERPRMEEEQLTTTAGLAALLGLSIHAFFDGVAIMSGFEQATATGLTIFLAVLLHKLPEGFSLASIVLATGRGRRSAALATVGLGIATIVGGLAVLGFGEVNAGLAAAFLAFAAGTFLYVGATDLVPAINQGRSRVALPLVVLGFLVLYVLMRALEAAGFAE